LRLLILSIRYAPEFTSNAIVVTGLAERLAARGHEVTVVAGTPHYQLPRVPPGYAARPFRREMLNGVRVIRCWAFPKSQGKIAKVLNYASFTLTSLIGGVFAGPADAILVVSPPFWLGLSALVFGRMRRCPVVYNAQDLFPDAYVASQEVRRGAFSRWMERLMNFVYRGVDRVSVITESFAQAISARGVDPAKIETIPNFVDASFVRPLPRDNSFREKYFPDAGFVAMYAGNIGYTHGTELLIDAAARLAGVSGLLFAIVGGGSKQADLVQLVKDRGLANVRFLPTQSPEFLAEMLASADVFVMTAKAGVGSASFPSRIYNSLLAARPVLASFDEDSDLAKLLRASGAGIVTPPGDVESFCGELKKLHDDAALQVRMGRAGSDFMAQNYSPQSVVEKYEALFQKLAVR
jgi:colanic acid biosynthesis glycosyl transferase WcaI